MASSTRSVFVTGGTGYIGRALIPRLVQRGHRVRALVRPGSENKLHPGADPVIGDALDSDTFTAAVRSGDTFVHLIGTPHPGPGKTEEFRRVDLVSVREACAAAKIGGASHFVYLSVAQPAPVMRVYVEVRAEGEAIVRDTGLPATFVRPWYVLGPGHRWPYILLPSYWVMERLPGTRETARRLGLVTIEQMAAALVKAVEHPPAEGERVLGVPEIRAATVSRAGW